MLKGRESIGKYIPSGFEVTRVSISFLSLKSLTALSLVPRIMGLPITYFCDHLDHAEWPLGQLLSNPKLIIGRITSQVSLPEPLSIASSVHRLMGERASVSSERLTLYLSGLQRSCRIFGNSYKAPSTSIPPLKNCPRVRLPKSPPAGSRISSQTLRSASDSLPPAPASCSNSATIRRWTSRSGREIS